VAVPIAGDYALSSANNNASPDEARARAPEADRRAAANFNLTLPAVSKSYWIWNATPKVATPRSPPGRARRSDRPGDKVPVWSDGAGVNTSTSAAWT